jgi:DNA repair exonuclease SbcCD nuclease subunit
LDSPLRGLDRYEGAPVERLRGATRRAFERLVNLAIEDRVSFVVIAGDLFDGERDDYQTAMFLQRQLRRLDECDIPVIIAYGNHDAANQITRRLDLPHSARVLPYDTPATIELPGAEAALHGMSYATRAVNEDLVGRYPQPVPGVLNVGVLHTSIDGRPGHDPYAPCTIDELVNRGYEYWALGHVHQREHHTVDGVHIVFPGCLQGRDVGECGPKGATVVVYASGAVEKVIPCVLAPVQWTRIEVDLSDVPFVLGAIEHTVERLSDLQASSDADLNAVRIVLHLSSAARRDWLREPDRYDAELRADAAGGDERLWIERIIVSPESASRPEVSGEALAAVTDVLASLRASPVQAAELGAAGLLAGIRSRFGSDLPAALQLGADVLEERHVNELLDEVEALLQAELEAGT